MTDDRNEAQRIYEDWHQFARSRDVDALLTLYAPDAVLETPLIPAVMGSDRGVLRGHAELRAFFEEGTRRRPNELVRWYREPGRFFYADGRLVWEYPRAAPDGDQFDLVEIMDLSGGKIAHHRIYWGWFGTGQLVASALKKARPGA
jgi:ketosteroid isomerase-like protein